MPSSTTATRRFEYVGGNSSKFWSLTIDGKDVIVCFGRIGTNGQSQMKSFPNEASAQKHADKLVSEKLAKGYVETD